MGYRTQFYGELAGNCSQETEKQVAAAIAQLPYFDSWYHDCTLPSTLDEIFDSGTFKWPSWRKDMETISKQFPTIPISIKGEGDDPDDIWSALFILGKCLYYKKEEGLPF